MDKTVVMSLGFGWSVNGTMFDSLSLMETVVWDLICVSVLVGLCEEFRGVWEDLQVDFPWIGWGNAKASLQGTVSGTLPFTADSVSDTFSLFLSRAVTLESSEHLFPFCLTSVEEHTDMSFKYHITY